MTAPVAPDEDTSPVVVVASTQQPWTAKRLADIPLTRVGSRRNPGYSTTDVDAFRKRAVDRITQLEGEVTYWHDQYVHARTALRARADSEGPYFMGETAELAVGAVAGGQQQAEQELGDARSEARRILAAARLQASEAEEYLRRARASVASGVAEADLPPEPEATSDPVADLEARSEWIRDCQRVIDEQRRELDQRLEALDGQRRGFVALLDRLEAAVPDVRAQIIDIAEKTAERAEAS